MNPTVSFVVPCYKYAHYLAECVNSILSQAYGDFEVLIMDDCSPDNTPEVAASFKDPRIIHVRHEKNIGVVANMNAGVKRARGKYIWGVSADDLLMDSDALKSYVEMAEKHPDVGYVFSTAAPRVEGEHAGAKPWHSIADRDQVFDSASFYARVVDRCMVHASAVMVRAACYKRIGYWTKEPHCHPDWFLWCRLALNYDVAYLAGHKACYRIHQTSEWHGYLRDERLNVLEHPQQMRWHLLRMARKLRDERKIQSTMAAIVRHYAVCLCGDYAFESVALDKPVRLCMREEEFDLSLAKGCREPQLKEEIRRRVWRDMADCYSGMGNRCYGDGDAVEARRLYGEAIRKNPAKLKTLAKWLALGVGLRW